MTMSYLDKSDTALVIKARRMLERRVRIPHVIRHCTATMETLTSWKASPPVLIASLLMPMVRNDMVPENELIFNFGQRPLHIARTATKLIYHDATLQLRRKPSPRVQNAETLRSLILFAFSDLDAALLTVAARLAYVPRLDILNDFERVTWAHKNMEVFVPFMEMLGLWQQRRSLANFSLMVLDAELYRQLQRSVNAIHERQFPLFERIVPQLTRLLEENLISGVQIALHETNPASLHQRLEAGRSRGEKLNVTDMNPLRVDVLTETEHDCYRILGLVHKCWQPSLRPSNPFGPERFNDLIATPRYNGYRCLTTTVVTPDNQYIEFRIRTRMMEQINIAGTIAAPFCDPVTNAWWSDELLMELLKPNITDTLRTLPNICAFTPNGEAIYPMRRGYTLVDFAYRINPVHAPHARAFYVNGTMRAPDYEIRHKDLIHIDYDYRYTSLKAEWEDLAHSAAARRGIKRYIRQQMEHGTHFGRKMIDPVLNRESNIYEMRFPAEKVDFVLAAIAKKLGCPTLEQLYVKVVAGEIPADDVVATMIEDELVQDIVLASGEPCPPDRISIARCWMQEEEPRKWERASRVTPGTEIVGKWTGKAEARTLVVHRADCPHAPAPEEAVMLRWKPPEALREAAEVQVTAPPRAMVPSMIMNAVTSIGKEDEKQALVLHRFNSEMLDGQSAVSMVVDAPNFDALRRLQDHLMAMQRSGYITDFKIWQLFPGQKTLIANKSERLRRENPYTLRQIRDRSMFFGREDEIERIIEQINRGETFIVLYGQKRIGKTSLLFQLAENVLPQACNILPVLFDSHSLAHFTPETFLYGLADAAYARLTPLLRHNMRNLRLRQRDLEGDPFTAFARWVQLVEGRLAGMHGDASHRPGPRLFFIVDEFTRAEEECVRGKLDVTFFDNLQWLVGNSGVGVLLCVHDHVYRPSSKSWGVIQRGNPIRLDTLETPAAARLVQQPLERIYKYPPEIVQYILDLTHCHPYLLHALCFELVRRMSDTGRDAVQIEDVHSAITTILKSGEHYFNHFRSQVDTFAWEVMKSIAYTGGDEWLTRDAIVSQLEKHNPNMTGDRWKITNAIGELNRAGLLRAQTETGQAVYRIRVRLLQLWIRHATNPIVSADLQY